MATVTSPSAADRSSSVPFLQNGDRLTRAEFERRYDADTGLKKAELIDGVVYMPSPVRQRNHGKPQFDIVGWLGLYVAATPGVEGADNASVRLDLENMPQPDAFLFLQPPYGGQAFIDEDDYVSGAPELVIEVAASSVSYDLHDKLIVYQRNKVREHVVWRVEQNAIDWFVLRHDTFERLPLSDGEVYQSEVFPGLWLDTKALIRGDLIQVTQLAQAGLQSRAHKQFLENLRKQNG